MQPTMRFRTVDNEKTTVCTVRVTAKTTSETKVSLDKISINLRLGDSPKKLNAVSTSSQALNQKLTWGSDNEHVIKVEHPNGVVSTVGVGTANVTVSDNGGPKTVYSITVVASNQIK